MTTMNTDILPQEGLILCAVSGGTDSMYLLCRLKELGYPVAAAHYNHGLRGREALRDEAFVRDFCRREAIPFLCRRGDAAAYAAENRLGREEAARRLRYDFLEWAADELGAAVIATAHTADDNVETLLLNLTRGAGLKGLCGIPPVRGRIIRPMLDVTRDEAAAYLRRKGIAHVEDSTNAADDYARNRIRHGAVPVLRAENPALAGTVARTASLLRRDEEYLSGLAADFIQTHGRENAVPAEALLALPWPVSSRVVRRMAGGGLSAGQVEAVLRLAAGGVLDVPGLRVGRSGDWLVFGAAEKTPLPARTLVPGQTLALPEAGLTVKSGILNKYPDVVHKSFNIFFFQCENICGNITVSARRPGDKYRPAGRGCEKTLKRLFLEKGVPRWERQTVPVLRDEAGVLAVYGMGQGERARALPGDTDVLKIEILRDGPETGGWEYASGY